MIHATGLASYAKTAIVSTLRFTSNFARLKFRGLFGAQGNSNENRLLEGGVFATGYNARRKSQPRADQHDAQVTTARRSTWRTDHHGAQITPVLGKKKKYAGWGETVSEKRELYSLPTIMMEITNA